MPGLRPPSPPRQSPFPIHDHHLPHTSGHRNAGLSSRPSAQPPTGQPVSKARGCGSLTAANGPRRVSTARRGRRPRCFPGTRGHWSMALPVSSRPSPRTAREPRHSSRGRAGRLRAASHGAMRTLTPPLGVGRENTLQHAQRRAPDVVVSRVSRRADPRRAGTFRSGL